MHFAVNAVRFLYGITLGRNTEGLTTAVPHSRRCAAPDRHLQVSRLPARLTAQEVNPFRPGVHPALQLAYPASGTGTYPALWNPGQQS